MAKKADLRIYDTNIPSGLSIVVRDLKEQGLSIENDIEDIYPNADPTMPNTVIINPPYNPSKDYYDRIKQCAQNNPASKFILFIPSLDSLCIDLNKAKKIIGKIKNLEYLGREGRTGNSPMKRLKTLTDALISQKQKILSE